VCTVLSSWWWAGKPPETCRALTIIKNIVKRCILLVVLKRIEKVSQNSVVFLCCEIRGFGVVRLFTEWGKRNSFCGQSVEFVKVQIGVTWRPEVTSSLLWEYLFYLLQRIVVFSNENTNAKVHIIINGWPFNECMRESPQHTPNYNKPAEALQCQVLHWIPLLCSDRPVVSKVCSGDPIGSEIISQWIHFCNGYFEVYLFLQLKE
jgi:hypothetical protein